MPVFDNAIKHMNKDDGNNKAPSGMGSAIAAARAASAAPAKKSNEEIAKEVIRGNWGVGQERKDKLTAAGYDYSAVQSIVNEMMKK